MYGSVRYRVRIRVVGSLDASWWAGLSSELAVEPQEDGTTLIRGELRDQAAVHGLLATIRDLGLSLVSAETIAES